MSFISERRFIMAVTPTALAATTTALQQNQQSQQNQQNQRAEAATGENTRVNVLAAAKQQLNVQILEASAQVSLTAGDNSQSLVFRAAIDRINELLSPEFGPDALQTPTANQDNSPQATAERILSMSTGFYESYAQQHEGEAPEDIANNFVSLIRGGFEQGFNEASNILEGLRVLNGDVASGISQTYELVQKGYDDFLAAKLATFSPNTTAANPTSVNPLA
jgi:hypothetical protein